ncbi:MAG: hypothetical protein HPZ91_15705 [Lentisphaeria bacterium]|nr:hypothetical protein [Lentisphaeria bacterium]
MPRFSDTVSRLEDELLNSVVPFWIEHAVDRENGGFFNSLDREGNCYDPVRSVAMQWRNVYMFAALFNSEYSRPEFLELSLHGFRFCEKQREPDGSYVSICDAAGNSIRGGGGRRNPMKAMTCIYAGCACAELFRATGEERFRAEARSCFDCYTAALAESEQDSFSPMFPVMRHRGCYMHLCHLCRTMLVQGCEFDDVRVRATLEKTFEVIPQFYCAGAGRWLEHAPVSGGFRLDSSFFRTVVPGHDFETMWFLAQGAELAGNRELLEKIPVWTRQIYGYTRDPEFGGLFFFMDALDKPVPEGMDMVKGWWTHNEALLAAAFSYRISGDEWFLEMFDDVNRWCTEHFRDPEFGEWYGLVRFDGSVRDGFKGSLSKTFFHLPRALYNCIRVFKELDK